MNKHLKHNTNTIHKSIGRRILGKFLTSPFSGILTDRCFISLQFRHLLGKKPNLKNPETFNEKIQWLKLYDRRPGYIMMSDKFEVRKYIKEKIGDKYLIPFLGLWENFNDINFNKLPNQFVLKCTHDSGSIFICPDKNTLDIDDVRKKIEERFNYNYFLHGREWCYKDIKPRIIAEKYMVDESGTGLKDYKFFCFNGEPKIIEVDIDRFINHKRNFYSLQWEYQPVQEGKQRTDPNLVIDKPPVLDEMIDIVRKLAAGIPHIRVDLYVIGRKIYFGELTFYDGNGYNEYNPPEWDSILGSWLRLPVISGGK
jgi:hypothetical protein